jgi:hypothetical protein
MKKKKIQVKKTFQFLMVNEASAKLKKIKIVRRFYNQILKRFKTKTKTKSKLSQ